MALKKSLLVCAALKLTDAVTPSCQAVRLPSDLHTKSLSEERPMWRICWVMRRTITKFAVRNMDREDWSSIIKRNNCYKNHRCCFTVCVSGAVCLPRLKLPCHWGMELLVITTFEEAAFIEIIKWQEGAYWCYQSRGISKNCAQCVPRFMH